MKPLLFFVERIIIFHSFIFTDFTCFEIILTPVFFVWFCLFEKYKITKKKIRNAI